MRKHVFLTLIAAVLSSCSPRTIALRSTTALLDKGASSLYEEPDPTLAKESFGSQLKMLEMLLRNEPDNKKLLKLAAEGFGGYAFLFLEDSQPERAKGFYRRGRDYALRALTRRKELAPVAEGDLAAAEKALQAAKTADAPALFWAAFCWANYINLSKDSASAVADLPRVAAMMRRSHEIAPNFHFAGADLFFGIYYASRPALLGGDINKAKAHFHEARRRTSGKYLMAYVLEAQYYAVAAQDAELFKSLLAKAQEAPAGQLANARLTDETAKLKANALLEKANELF